MVNLFRCCLFLGGIKLSIGLNMGSVISEEFRSVLHKTNFKTTVFKNTCVLSLTVVAGGIRILFVTLVLRS